MRWDPIVFESLLLFDSRTFLYFICILATTVSYWILAGGKCRVWQEGSSASRRSWDQRFIVSKIKVNGTCSATGCDSNEFTYTFSEKTKLKIRREGRCTEVISYPCGSCSQRRGWLKEGDTCWSGSFPTLKNLFYEAFSTQVKSWAVLMPFWGPWEGTSSKVQGLLMALHLGSLLAALRDYMGW